MLPYPLCLCSCLQIYSTFRSCPLSLCSLLKKHLTSEDVWVCCLEAGEGSGVLGPDPDPRAASEAPVNWEEGGPLSVSKDGMEAPVVLSEQNLLCE